MLIHIWESVLSEYYLVSVEQRELARLFMDIGIFIGFCTYSGDQEGEGGEGLEWAVSLLMTLAAVNGERVIVSTGRNCKQ